MNDIGPYQYERKRHRLGEYPRPPQPNTSQPNQKVRVQGNTTSEYWNNAQKKYMDRRG